MTLSSPRRWSSRPAAALAVAVAVLVAGAAPAAAHAEPSDVSPAACATVDSVAEVRIRAGEEIGARGSRLDVLVDGTVVASGGLDLDQLDHLEMVATVPAGVEGPVEVRATLASAADDDVVDASWAFGIGVPAPDSCALAVADAGGGSSLGIVLVVGTSVALVAALVVVGLRSRRTGVA